MVTTSLTFSANFSSYGTPVCARIYLHIHFCVYSYKNCDCGDCRFETTVRIVIFSGSLTSACWEDVQQFGWFIDVNIQDEDGSFVDTLSSGSFAKDLDHFVASMTQSEHADILRGVDFSVVSPHVCLIASVQGEPRKAPPCFKSLNV